MIISTTSSLNGKTIKEYRGIVFGEVINGINFMKDFSASISNFVGGRAVEYEKELVNSRADAINEMIERAKKIGANALIGVKVDVESLGEENGSMLMVVATGTAVVVE
ncbi:MAG: heavy metal-binding domain-containing protein [Firmicutes bacterium]|nr:heavy metal-binding domain-containing protein [Bacillota bacterium]